MLISYWLNWLSRFLLAVSVSCIQSFLKLPWALEVSFIFEPLLQPRHGHRGTRIEIVSINAALFTFNIYIYPGFYPKGEFAYMQNLHVYPLLSY